MRSECDLMTQVSPCYDFTAHWASDTKSQSIDRLVSVHFTVEEWWVTYCHVVCVIVGHAASCLSSCHGGFDVGSDGVMLFLISH